MPKLLAAIPDPTPDSDLTLVVSRGLTGAPVVTLEYAGHRFATPLAALPLPLRQALRGFVRDLLESAPVRDQLTAAGFVPTP